MITATDLWIISVVFYIVGAAITVGDLTMTPENHKKRYSNHAAVGIGILWPLFFAVIVTKFLCKLVWGLIYSIYRAFKEFFSGNVG